MQPFNLLDLPHQLRQEGGRFNRDDQFKSDDFILSNITPLINKIIHFTNEKSNRKIFNLNPQDRDGNELPISIDKVIDNQDTMIKIISLANLPDIFKIKPLVMNLIGGILLRKSYHGDFKINPTILFVDEAHLFFNKMIYNTNTDENIPLDKFNRIVKECRKYGLFTCLATQRPKDMPQDLISQAGNFIIHRLANINDRDMIKYACSFATPETLDVLPNLSAGETLVVGTAFSSPMLVKINMPTIKPNSSSIPIF